MVEAPNWQRPVVDTQSWRPYLVPHLEDFRLYAHPSPYSGISWYVKCVRGPRHLTSVSARRRLAAEEPRT